MIRLFIALVIPEEVQNKIFEYCIDAAGKSSGHKWEVKDKIHLTLKFIGEVREDILPDILNEINFVENYSSFFCEISRFGFFFRDSQAKILWCNLQTDQSIINLVKEINERLSKLDIEADRRKFKGHLTLLRIKNKVSNDFIKKFEEFRFDPINFNASQIALIQSTLKPSGSEYKVLKIYKLK